METARPLIMSSLAFFDVGPDFSRNLESGEIGSVNKISQIG